MPQPKILVTVTITQHNCFTIPILVKISINAVAMLDSRNNIKFILFSLLENYFHDISKQIKMKRGGRLVF